MTRRIGIVVLGALAVAGFGVLGAQGSAARRGVVDPQVAAAVARHGSAKVVIVFHTPRLTQTPGSIESTVRSVRGDVLRRAGDGFRPTERWDAVTAVPGWINSRGLERLASDPDVRRIGLDGGAGHAADAQSSGLIHATQAHALGYTGEGITVGILDGGIDETHPDLKDALVGEHCFNDCPAGPNKAPDQAGHGTNVSGIIASKGTIAPPGIAPQAKLVMVKMLDRNDTFDSSDQIVSSLNWLATNRPDVKVVNMSIDTNALFSGYCDNAAAWTMALSSAVSTLHSAGVTLFASAGNDKATREMAAPACLKNVVAVGAVYDSAYGADQLFCNDPSRADRVTCFSDSSSALDLLAPGAAITSTGLRSQGSPISTYYGTSQASPHAAATAALVLQAHPTLTPQQVESILRGTGKPVEDWRSPHRVTTRIDALGAVQAQLTAKTLTAATAGVGSGTVTSSPAGIRCPPTCSHTYAFGTEFNLTARPAPRSFFAGWSGTCLGRLTCTVTMAADHAVTATFKRLKCTVPKVKGKRLRAAKRAIRKAHCSVGKVTRVFSHARRGRVVGQRPKPGRIRPSGSRVALKVSRGRRRR